MIDPMVSLAFAVFSNKGAYALLVGSGISHAAGIPTGWEIVLDLVRKVAKLTGEDCGADPVEWYKKKFGTEPDYGQLLDDIAKTPAERQQLLRGYFEPTEDERAQGIKLPSAAHKAIAQLVAAGFIRVIITTNFDRLIERALEEAGVSPAVISTTDQISGALPLIHAGPTVIKLHGDYQDTRIKNTGVELAAYDVALNGLLDRILDEYGLIVSGWSGDWDLALRSAIERCPNHRFTTFWTARSPLGDKATQLAKQRLATVLQIKDANALFVTLWEKVQALQDMNAPHPLSAKMAIATLKHYLEDPLAKIRLRDFVHDETEILFSEMSGPAFPLYKSVPSQNEVRRRAVAYETVCGNLIGMIATGCYCGGADEVLKQWVKCLERIANPVDFIDESPYFKNMRRFPALLLLYSAGVAAVAAGNNKVLTALLTGPQTGGIGGPYPVCLTIYPMMVMEDQIGNMLFTDNEWTTPVSYYLFIHLRETLRAYLPRDEDYEKAFDRFEYIFGLIHAEIRRRSMNDGWEGPIGRFIWSRKDFLDKGSAAYAISNELSWEGADLPLLKTGLFGGEVERMRVAINKYNVFLKSMKP